MLFRSTRTAFALEESAGDLPCRVGLLTILDREWEKREVGGVVLHRDGAKDNGLAELHEARALRELGHAADLERERAPCELALHSLHHVVLLTSFADGVVPPLKRGRSAHEIRRRERPPPGGTPTA